ncbi:DUF1987 domain-containing protein [Vibrio sp. Of7-15]|uniref:DUF1987 domain-containing protein n=1 Tax=Vibrio sp. Of7-15 TaxID=2724879 RepID=UPI001EF19B9F|nr:DUF1987 domain-containing protein [Vibrio sp. Of7-15]MCG7495380.1 DUF1987 domain-containing protein [Vibrio sp. Of7-15]
MENLDIVETKYTPNIQMNVDGTISIKGKSYPENTFEFYEPVMAWMEALFEQENTNIVVINFEITYFNSSSSKLFFDFFDLLEEKNDEFDITINWRYEEENESAEEAGEDFIEDFEELTINLVKIGSDDGCS